MKPYKEDSTGGSRGGAISPARVHAVETIVRYSDGRENRSSPLVGDSVVAEERRAARPAEAELRGRDG